MTAAIVGGNQGKLTLSADSSYGTQVVLDGLKAPSNSNEAATKGYVDSNVVDVDDTTVEKNTSNANKLQIKDSGVGPTQLSTTVAGDGISGGGGSALAISSDDTTIDTNLGNVRVKPGGIAATQLADSAITSGKLHQSVAGDGLSHSSSALSVNVDNTSLALSSGAVQLKDQGVTASKISSAALGGGLSGGDGTELTVHVDDSSIEISSAKVAVKSGGITTAHVASQAITSAKINPTISLQEVSASVQMTAPAFVATSDQRLKQNIIAIDPVDALHEVMHIRPVRYAFKHAPSVERRGVIAQELQSIAPHLVYTVPNGVTNETRLAVNYVDMISGLVGAIQALQKQIDDVNALIHQ